MMFFARWEQGGPWTSQGVEGTARWLRRVFALLVDPERAARPEGPPDAEAERSLRRKTQMSWRPGLVLGITLVRETF